MMELRKVVLNLGEPVPDPGDRLSNGLLPGVLETAQCLFKARDLVCKNPCAQLDAMQLDSATVPRAQYPAEHRDVFGS
jgi:hypothetical protein